MNVLAKIKANSKNTTHSKVNESKGEAVTSNKADLSALKIKNSGAKKQMLSLNAERQSKLDNFIKENNLEGAKYQDIIYFLIDNIDKIEV